MDKCLSCGDPIHGVEEFCTEWCAVQYGGIGFIPSLFDSEGGPDE